MSKTQIDSVTRDFLLLIVKKYASSYAIWSHVKKEAKTKGPDNVNLKVMAYNNVNKRITNLAENRLLEEMKTSDSSQHGRKDFKLTMKGIELLIPHIISHPESIQTVIEYMEKFGMDKTIFKKLLTDRIQYTLDFLNSTLETVKNNPELSETYPVKDVIQLQKVQKEMGKITIVRIQDDINILDSLTTKQQHALRVSSSKPTRKKS